MSIEASATDGFRLTNLCVTTSNATAAAVITVTVQRRTTASSGGTAASKEGTSQAQTVSRLFSGVSAADDFPGIVRNGGTPGTAGAILFQQSFAVGTLGNWSPPPVCFTFGQRDGQPLTVPLGVANGVSINVSAAGTGGLASGGIAAVVQMGN